MSIYIDIYRYISVFWTCVCRADRAHARQWPSGSFIWFLCVCMCVFCCCCFNFSFNFTFFHFIGELYIFVCVVFATFKKKKTTKNRPKNKYRKYRYLSCHFDWWYDIWKNINISIFRYDMPTTSTLCTNRPCVHCHCSS